jgi:hypothetical protein
MKPIDRIQLHASILDLIDRKRSQTGDQHLGSGIEQNILTEALRELEEDVLADPGAFEPMLVRLRQPRRS